MNKNCLSLLSCIFLSSLQCANAHDWSMWFGPEANGVSRESIVPSHDITWTKELGEGYSAVSVCEGHLLTAGHVEGKDIIYCLDPVTGKELWTYSFESDAGRSYGGSLATPVTDGERVWYFNRHAKLICLDFASGELLWERSLMKDDTQLPEWKVASCVLIYNDLAIVAMGTHGAAVNKLTGEPLWASAGMATYSTPSVLTYGGKDYLIVHGATSTNVLSLPDGQLLDSVSYKMDNPNIGASPLIVDAKRGRFFVSMGDSSGRGILYSFDGLKLTEIWNVEHLKCQFTSPVLHDGVIYGSHGNTNARKALTALDAESGTVLWQGAQRFGSPLIVGEMLIYLDERGTLTYLHLDKTKESVISSARVLKGGKCWQMPVVANGYLYCRNSLGTLVCIKCSDLVE